MIDRSTTSESVGEQIYKTLKNNIIYGRIKTDEIHTEISIASQFNASRTPAREALRRLENEGFLQIIPRKGYQVCGLHDRDIIDIYDIAIALEPMSAYLAAKHRDQDVLQQLRKIADNDASFRERFLEVPDDPQMLQMHSRLNREFHVLIAQASGNQYLSSYVETIQDKLLMHEAYYANFRNYTQNTSQWRFITHADICDAIEMQDAEMAELLMRKHFIKSKEIWLEKMSL